MNTVAVQKCKDLSKASHICLQLAYLPDRRRDYIFEDEDGHESELSLDGRSDNIISDDLFKGEKKTKRRSMLAWFKLKARF